MDLRSQILDLLNKEDEFENKENNQIKEFNRDSYNELYDKINKLVIGIMYSSYTTLFLSEKLNENYELKKIQEIITNNKVLEYAKVFLNLYWQEINDLTKENLNNESNVKSQVKDILNLNILKNNHEVFSLLKSTSIYVMMILSKTVFDSADTYDEFTKKLFNMIRALLEINKITCLDDEDELEGDMEISENNEKRDIFWI